MLNHCGYSSLLSMRVGQASDHWQWEALEALEAWLFSPPAATSLLSGTGVTALAPKGPAKLALLSCKMTVHKLNLDSFLNPKLLYRINWTQITDILCPFRNLTCSCLYSLVVE